MERLDFASVMAVLRRNIPDENFGNQADFLDSLFLDMGFSPQTAMEFDQGQVCRWIIVKCFCTAFPVSAKVSLPKLMQSNMARNTPMSSM